MSRESRMLAGVILVTVPTVMFGGLTLLHMLAGRASGYFDNPLRHDMWRAGHAHAGVYLILSLVLLRLGVPVAAILIPAAFFLSVASPSATEPNALINLAYAGAASMVLAVLSLGIGLIRSVRAAGRAR
jgi:hypothetical protein